MQLTDKNLVRQDKTSISIKGMKINIEYKLHKAEVPNKDDPSGTPVDMWYLYFPQISTCYMNHSEELVFEDFQECFEKDFIYFYAQKLLEERMANAKK